MSTGSYRLGGPEPFEEGVTCPVCMGKGTFTESKIEADTLIVLFDANQWFKPQILTLFAFVTLPSITEPVLDETATVATRTIHTKTPIL